MPTFSMPHSAARPCARAPQVVAIIKAAPLGMAAAFSEDARTALAAARTTSNISRLPQSSAPPVPRATFMPDLTQSRMGVTGLPDLAQAMGVATAETFFLPKILRSASSRQTQPAAVAGTLNRRWQFSSSPGPMPVRSMQESASDWLSARCSCMPIPCSWA